ncbi:MAG: phosphoglycerate kinase [Acidimicrobiales bacterium]
MAVLEDLPPVPGKAVLVRADLNVPLRPLPDGSSEVIDDFRIRAAVPTIAWLARAGAKVTVCSHLGRPKGRPDPRYAMAPVAARLGELIAAEVGDDLASGVSVMENLRFDPGETANDSSTVDRLVAGQDLYVNDAFGAAHRAHASVVGPPSRLPSAAGRVLAREVSVLVGVRDDPVRPLDVIIGGAKASGKLGVMTALVERAEVLMVGGGMCFTFLAALGHDIGDSLFEPDYLDACRALVDSGRRVMLPTDIVALGPGGEVGGTGGEVRVVGRDVPDGWKGLDIGPDTAAEFADELSGAGTVCWNGPMGVCEDPRFAAGTATVARAVASCAGFTVVGGGDSAAALGELGLDGEVDHLSTGGGASLELLEKGDLPGLAALRVGVGV